MSDKIHTSTGAFDKTFSDNRKWKIDTGLLEAIMDLIPKGSTVVDLGAGYGRYVKALLEAGYNAVGLDGIEGVEQATDRMVRHFDLTTRLRMSMASWTISIECGEHIPPEFTQRFIDNVSTSARDGIILSWARLKQRGHNHVACHEPEWIAQQFVSRHWEIDEEKMHKAREIAGKGWNRKLLVFTRLDL